MRGKKNKVDQRIQKQDGTQHRLFPECVTFPFYPGGLGAEGVFAWRYVYVRNRSQPFVSVRAIAIWLCLWQILQKGFILGGLNPLVASFRVVCFVTYRKSLCVAGAILLRHFQKMRCSFRGRRSTLDVSIVILRGRRSTLDVLRVFCKSHWQGCMKCRQGADTVAHMAFCEM